MKGGALLRLAATLACLGVALPVSAEPLTVAVGAFSFDELVPADPADFFSLSTNAFSINNFSGPLPVGLDLSVLDALLFTNLVVTTSLSAEPILLADLGPGQLVEAPPFPLQFAGDVFFTFARLRGTIAPGAFRLSDDRLFTPARFDFDVQLLPSGGDTNLTSGTLALIEFSGDAQAVPEPGTLALFAVGISALFARNRNRRGARAGSLDRWPGRR